MDAADTKNSNRILAGLVVGIAAGGVTLAVGTAWPGVLAGARKVSEAVLDPFGQVFLRLLFFVVIPLVFASLASGVAQIGRLERLGPLAARTFGVFLANMVVAAALGLLLMNALNPGGLLPDGAKALLLREHGG
ncbi:MAG: dicarboxylate/amino acid:cation symporter, partial [Opitutaceae bacterium]|nr:dicarboxylate/amino acid:cation symporter [Opitutaceae bacterium]